MTPGIVAVDRADLRAVVEYAEFVHSKDDPVCAPARRLLARLEEPSGSVADAASDFVAVRHRVVTELERFSNLEQAGCDVLADAVMRALGVVVICSVCGEHEAKCSGAEVADEGPHRFNAIAWIPLHPHAAQADACPECDGRGWNPSPDPYLDHARPRCLPCDGSGKAAGR